jgi:hypothetical protein
MKASSEPLVTGAVVDTPTTDAVGTRTTEELLCGCVTKRTAGIICIVLGCVAGMTPFAPAGAVLILVGAYLHSGFPAMTAALCILTIPFVMLGLVGAFVAIFEMSRDNDGRYEYHVADTFVFILWIMDAVLGLTAIILGLVGCFKLLCCPNPIASTASVNLWGFRVALISAFPMVVAAILVLTTGGPCERVQCNQNYANLKMYSLMAAVWTPIADGVIAGLLYYNYVTVTSVTKAQVGETTKLNP